jgi:hypothetical protein
MVILMEEAKLVRVTVTLDAVDVALLDRLASFDGLNRSAELRAMLAQLRPVLRATVHAFEGARQQRDMFDAAAAQVELSKLQELIPEAERIQDAYMGAMARMEGLAAAADVDPRPSNHGGHTPSPKITPTPPNEDRGA